MRDFEVRFAHQAVAEQHQIEIERARGAGKRPRAAVVRLDLTERIEQGSRVEAGLADERRIQIERLIFESLPYRVGFDDVGEDGIVEESREAVGRECQGGTAVAEVAAQGDGNPRAILLLRDVPYPA